MCALGSARSAWLVPPAGEAKGRLTAQIAQGGKAAEPGGKLSAGVPSLQPLPAPVRPCWAPPQCMQHIRSCVLPCTTGCWLPTGVHCLSCNDKMQLTHCRHFPLSAPQPRSSTARYWLISKSSFQQLRCPLK